MPYVPKTPHSDVSREELWKLIVDRRKVIREEMFDKIDQYWRIQITQRVQYLKAHQKLSKRQPHGTPEEKERCRLNTQRCQALRAKIRRIEDDLLWHLRTWTRHTDIYNPLKVEGRDPANPITWSLLEQYRVEWVRNTKRLSARHPERKRVSRDRTKRRHKLAICIQDLRYVWLTALTLCVFNKSELPKRLIVNPRNFRP